MLALQGKGLGLPMARKHVELIQVKSIGRKSIPESQIVNSDICGMKKNVLWLCMPSEFWTLFLWRLLGVEGVARHRILVMPQRLGTVRGVGWVATGRHNAIKTWVLNHPCTWAWRPRPELQGPVSSGCQQLLAVPCYAPSSASTAWSSRSLPCSSSGFRYSAGVALRTLLKSSQSSLIKVIPIKRANAWAIGKTL